jgi:broad specificity phosphatase PhoE
MSRLCRLVMVRHAETVGRSSVRFHGSTDVALSEEGRAHMREVARSLRHEVFDLVVASPLRRSWEAAAVCAAGAPVLLVHDFREIDFGRWEGCTREEIEARDPVLFRDWQARAPGFEFPGGERRADFRARVLRGLETLKQSGAAAALVVVHKGVVRTLAEALLGAPLAEGEPELGGVVGVSCGPDDRWRLGRRSSNPPGIEEPAAVAS